MTKRTRRTKEQQEYRDNLAHDLKNLRQYGEIWKELARILLEEKKKTTEYKDSSTAKSRQKEERFIWCINNKSIDGIRSRVKRLPSLDTDTIEEIHKALGSRASYVFADYFEKIKPEDREKIAEMIIDTADGDDLGYFLETFKSKTKLGKHLFNKIMERYPEIRAFGGSNKNTPIFKSLRNFEWLDKDILLKLLGIMHEGKDYEYEHRILWEGLKAFTWLDNEVALILMKIDWTEKGFAENLESFEWMLDEKIARKLIEDWYWKYVAKHPEKFRQKKEK